MALPYETATSGKGALDETQKMLRGFGATSFGVMEDFAAGTATVQFRELTAVITSPRAGAFCKRGWPSTPPAPPSLCRRTGCCVALMKPQAAHLGAEVSVPAFHWRGIALGDPSRSPRILSCGQPGRKAARSAYRANLTASRANRSGAGGGDRTLDLGVGNPELYR